ncbi:PLD nuclease N-terminal domain-containing protein [Roseivirga sp.]|uniref:PLD nuclease N-terminal domain-containing protein n=1 Tax=Roseivirga sp. TaxID=1964215 RepID=UPI002B265C75|nr:PLD nuclease N-terminal domain-containing protein [Roseivirga sp.]
MNLLGMPGGMGMMIVFFVFIPFALWVIALVDCLKGNFSGDNKVIWVLVIIFLPVLGSILYFFVGRNQKTA